MYETRYHRPASLDEAATLFAAADDPRYLAGGQTLIPTIKQRLAAPSDLIDITHIDGLKGIAIEGDIVAVGGGTTHAEVAGSPVVSGAIPALSELAGSIGDPAVRARGTIGGSLANNDPAADHAAAVLGLGATVRTSKRAIAADDFFTGLFSTALDDGEIVTRIDFPIPAKAAYRKFLNPASRYAMAGAFVAVMKDGAIRVAITGAGSRGVYRAEAIEQVLAKSWDPAAVAAVTIDPEGMLSDIHGSAEYRANLVKVMARRAAAAAG